MSNGKEASKPVGTERIKNLLVGAYESGGFFEALIFADGMKVFAGVDDHIIINEVVSSLSDRFRREWMERENAEEA
jgi:hypothetical protein